MPDGQLEPRISAEQIQLRIAEMGRAIGQDFPEGGRRLWLVAALKGACLFQADLARAIDRDTALGFVRAVSYGAGTESSGSVMIVNELHDNIANADVILVEDIVDTGRTARVLLDHLAAHGPRTLRLASLLDKPSRREMPIAIDYRGFEIADEFVVGYGLDHAESYRNLPGISVLQL
ncbi:MAG: hypoxanthine phosphoribosyltransferase [Acidobacteria bacterium]|nr:hypoxanthine phosphoribosyltransferase [Acidobacteriota bacterium]MDA1235171.1 hypoxanthine phosphoribosyltransferase [Acidobacteriota bacterium]